MEAIKKKFDQPAFKIKQYVVYKNMLNSMSVLRSQNLFYASGSVATFHVSVHHDNSLLLREFAYNYSISDSERVAKTDGQTIRVRRCNQEGTKKSNKLPSADGPVPASLQVMQNTESLLSPPTGVDFVFIVILSTMSIINWIVRSTLT